jgi:hypothetical protein
MIDWPEHLDLIGMDTDRGGTRRITFHHSCGSSVYFSRIGTGPRWKVEIYDHDEEPDRRCLVLYREANRAATALRFACAWWRNPRKEWQPPMFFRKNMFGEDKYI